jgi:hypothetical protein
MLLTVALIERQMKEHSTGPTVLWSCKLILCAPTSVVMRGLKLDAEMLQEKD